MRCVINNDKYGVNLNFDSFNDSRYWDSAFIEYEELENDSVLLEKIFSVATTYNSEGAFKHSERAKKYNILKFLLDNYATEIVVDLEKGVVNTFNITWIDEAEGRVSYKNSDALVESSVSSMCTTGNVKMDKNLSLSSALMSVCILSKVKVKRELNIALESILRIAGALEEKGRMMDEQ